MKHPSPLLAVLLITSGLASPALASGSVAASYHSAVITPGGSLWAWGNNTNGQLCLGHQVQQTLPAQVAAPAGFAAVSAGQYHTILLKADGSVWACGANNYGQLGDQTTTQRTSPVAVKLADGTALTAVVAVAAGNSHSLALRSDGSVVGWGYNAYGQVGDTTTTQRTGAVAVKLLDGTPLTGVVAIAAGGIHSLALKSDATAVAWGGNSQGQLGDGSTTPRNGAVPVSNLGSVTGVAAGGYHSLALLSGGSLWAWGANGSGQLGDGTTSGRTSPAAVDGVTGVVAFSAGASHSVAVETDGTVHTWGGNTFGQLGDGTTLTALTPQLVDGITDAISVVAASEHTLAVTTDGVVWAFGRNANGELGDGTTLNRLSPVAISIAGFEWKAGTPTFSPAPGLRTTTLNVALASATAGATIRYTTDGSEPLASSPVYASPIPVTITTTLKARAYKAGVPDSNTAVGLYTLQAVAPTFSPWGATFTTPQTVSIATSTSGATIRYTTDGTEPTAGSSLYSGAVPINQITTLKAAAFKDGWTASAVTASTYTMKVGTPTFAPDGGSYGAPQQVVASSVTPDAALRYTTSGLEPVEADPLVAGSVWVDRSLTLKVKGWRPGWLTSDTAAASYFLTLGTAATPVATPVGGAYTASTTISLSCATAGALIRYTRDGSDPGPQSPVFAAPFTLSSTTTLKARAYKADMTPSAVMAAVYTIDLGSVEAPILSLPSGRYATTRSVTVTVATQGAAIHYTTAGSDPTDSDPVVASGSALTIDRALILKVRAFKDGLPPSAVVRRDYIVSGAIAAGGQHTLALKADGTAWSWGVNSGGQLGDGTTSSRGSPVRVKLADGTFLADVVRLAAGANHSLAVKADGSVLAFGANGYGQLGDTTTTQRTGAVAVKLADGTPLTGVIAVAAGDYHSLALRSDGTVLGWGYNGSGQVGDGTTTQRTAAVPVLGLTGVVAIACGGSHSLALLGDGSVAAWGANSAGQLGDGTTTPRNAPAAVTGPSGVTRIEAGASFSLALSSSGMAQGTLWAWGYGASGQLGDGTTTTRKRPISGPSNIALLVAGSGYTLAAASDGRLWAWGDNGWSQLGDGTTTSRAVPVALPATFADAVALEAGSAHSLASVADGGVWTWGYNPGGLGDGSTSSRIPVQVAGLTLASNASLATDPDDDGLSNAAEYRIGTDPLNPDSNGDGLPDGVELEMGRPPFDPDVDGDGLGNLAEMELGTDPFTADTDGDGALDGADAFPFDPTKWQAVANPNDHTPPIITILTPPVA